MSGDDLITYAKDGPEPPQGVTILHDPSSLSPDRFLVRADDDPASWGWVDRPSRPADRLYRSSWQTATLAADAPRLIAIDARVVARLSLGINDLTRLVHYTVRDPGGALVSWCTRNQRRPRMVRAVAADDPLPQPGGEMATVGDCLTCRRCARLAAIPLRPSIDHRDPVAVLAAARDRWVSWMPGDGSAYVVRVVTVEAGPRLGDEVLLLSIGGETLTFQYPTVEYRRREPDGMWTRRRCHGMPSWAWDAARPLLEVAGVVA